MKPPELDPGWPAEIAELYRNDLRYYWDRTIEPQSWNSYQTMLRICFSFVPGQRNLKILDVGCAQATLAMLLAEKGHDVWAVDLRQPFLDYAATRYTHGDIHFVQGNVLEEIELPGDFDLIFANQIIEHLVYPGAFIDRLASWLRRGGRLVITTPNADYVNNRFPTFTELGDPDQWQDRQFTAGGEGHFFAYRDAELLPLFEAAGLARLRVAFYESPWISGHLKLHLLARVLPLKLLSLLDRGSLALPGLGRRLAYQLLVTGELA